MKRTKLLRKSPWKPKASKSPLRSKSRIKPVNRARKAKRFEADFGGERYRDHIASLPCAWCLIGGPSDPHHVRSRGAGGKAADVVPLCRECHDGIHRRGYGNGQRSYLAARAARIRAAFLEQQDNSEDDAA